MFRNVILLSCLLFCTQALATADKLDLRDYPSTYLNDCEGVAYVYKTSRTLKLGVRAVKNCSRIRIDGNTYTMEKYHLGFRFETEIPTASDINVEVWSKRHKLKDYFIIESDTHRRHNPQASNQGKRHIRQNPVTSQTHTSRSLAALKTCSKAFNSSTVKEYCHEKMQKSQFNIGPIVDFCARRPGSNKQKQCLDDSLSFSYEPQQTMAMCTKEFPSSTMNKKCINSAKKYEKSPTKVIEKCTNMFPQNSKRMECIDKFSDSRYPERQINLLSKCAKTFFSSQIDQCYQQTSKIKNRRTQTLEACTKNFPQTSNKLRCLTLASGIRGVKTDAVVQQCIESHFQMSKQLSCIEKFSAK